LNPEKTIDAFFKKKKQYILWEKTKNVRLSHNKKKEGERLSLGREKKFSGGGGGVCVVKSKR